MSDSVASQSPLTSISNDASTSTAAARNAAVPSLPRQPQAAAATATTLGASAASISPHPLRRRLSTISSSDHLYLRLPSGTIKYIKPSTTAHVQQEDVDGVNGVEDTTAITSRKTKKARKSTDAGGSSRSRSVVSLGKFGNFHLEDLQGVPFGRTWEIVPPKSDLKIEEQGVPADVNGLQDISMDKPHSTMEAATTVTSGSKQQAKGRGRGRAGDGDRNKKGTPSSSTSASSAPGILRIMAGPTLAELEETSATNQDIFDDPSSGPSLTMADVQALRDSGLQGQDLIDSLTRASRSFDKRTVWSQEKFIKKKEAKHLKFFTPLAPSLAVMAEYHFERSPEKIRGLRVDALAQMMSFAGVAPGGRYLVVDGTSGLLTAACLDRMGGSGRIIAIHDNDSVPEFEIVRSLNFPSQVIDDVLRTLHWAQVEEDYQHLYIPPVPARLDEAIKDSGPEGLREYRARERERYRITRKYAAKTELDDLRHELFDGDFDGVLVACAYEPVSIINSLLPYLAGSAQIAVHSTLYQPLVEAHAILRGSHEIVNLSLTEPWLRRYQVLPGRTHPEMNTSATAGYILHGIRVLTDGMAREEMIREKERLSAESMGLRDEGGAADQPGERDGSQRSLEIEDS